MSAMFVCIQATLRSVFLWYFVFQLSCLIFFFTQGGSFIQGSKRDDQLNIGSIKRPCQTLIIYIIHIHAIC